MRYNKKHFNIGAKMEAYVGIDVSKRWLNLALVVDGDCVCEFRIDYNQSEIANVINKLHVTAPKRELLFACEATGQYHKAMIYQLHELGYRVKVINPRMTHHEKMAKNETSGTDAIDAIIIAKRLQNGDDRFWKPEHEGNVELRELLLRRDQLKKEINREKNRLDRFTRTGPTLRSLKRSISFLENEFELIEEEIKKVIDNNEDIQHDMKLLQSIPGVGYYSSLAFLARIQDVARFNSASELVKYLGLAPLNKISGSSIRKSRLSKTGDALYRSTLYIAAVGQTYRDNVYGKYYRNLRNRGKAGKTSIVALMRKMTRAMYAVLRDQQPFSNELYGNPRIALKNVQV